MFTVKEAGKKAGKDVVVIFCDGRQIGAASIPFIKWMQQWVPKSQLTPEHAALIQWYEKRATP